MISWAVWVFLLVAEVVLAMATFSKFSSCISMSFICCIILVPSKGVKFCFTTMNSTEYYLRFLGLHMATRQTPSGLSAVLFHICNTRFVGCMLSLLTYLLGNTLNVASQSLWNFTGFEIDKHLCINFPF